MVLSGVDWSVEAVALLHASSLQPHLDISVPEQGLSPCVPGVGPQQLPVPLHPASQRHLLGNCKCAHTLWWWWAWPGQHGWSLWAGQHGWSL